MTTPYQTTEQALVMWRGSQSSAERMTASLLLLADFSNVDPQLPLGGGDGNKDILCERAGETFVVGCFFPNGEKKYADVKRKFIEDLEGRERNARDSFVFATNAYVTPGQREELVKIGTDSGARSVEVFHRERLIVLLDSTQGLPIRSRHLHLLASPEEQMAFFSSFSPDPFKTMPVVSVGDPASESECFDIAEPTDVTKMARFPFCKSMSVRAIGQLHANLVGRIDLPASYTERLGKLRTVQVWVGGAGSSIESARFVPPPPGRVHDLLDALLADWSKQYDDLTNAPERGCAIAIAAFHHRLMSIHPFSDGNGRVGRALMVIQGVELMPLHPLEPVVEQQDYYDALSAADRGSLGELESQVMKWFGLDDEKRSPLDSSTTKDGWFAR